MSFSRRKGILLPRSATSGNKADKHVHSPKIRYRYNIHWIFPMLFVTLAVAFVVVYLCQFAQLIRVRYDISKLRQERSRIIEQKRLVKLDIEKMAAPERIEKIACTKLKMIHPKKRTVLSLRTNTNTADDSEIVMDNR